MFLGRVCNGGDQEQAKVWRGQENCFYFLTHPRRVQPHSPCGSPGSVADLLTYLTSLAVLQPWGQQCDSAQQCDRGQQCGSAQQCGTGDSSVSHQLVPEGWA